MDEVTKEAPKNQWVKQAIDIGAPLVFAAVYFVTKDFMKATAVLIGASVIAVVAGLIIDRRIPMMPLITAGVAIVFGGLTLYFKDPRILKMKMTILYGLLAAVLLIGQAFNKPFLKMMLGGAVPLRDEAWPKLTIIYALFFAVLAVINEIIWRTQPDGTWVAFKASIFVILIAFSILLTPFLMKNMVVEDKDISTK
jgi:intracellular septation protein